MHTSAALLPLIRPLRCSVLACFSSASAWALPDAALVTVHDIRHVPPALAERDPIHQHTHEQQPQAHNSSVNHSIALSSWRFGYVNHSKLDLSFVSLHFYLVLNRYIFTEV